MNREVLFIFDIFELGIKRPSLIVAWLCWLSCNCFLYD